MNKHIIDKLTAQLILYKKDKSKKWKAIALQKAISNLKDIKFEIKSSNDVKDIKGIGKGILKRIDEILKTGTLEDLSNTNLLVNTDDILNIFKNITGVGDVKALEWINAGYSSINDILNAIKDGKIEVTHHIKIGLKYFDEFQKRIPQSEVKQIEKKFKNILSKFNHELSFHICGSYRRGCPDSGDIDILFTNFNDNPTTHDIYSNKYLSNLVTVCKENGFIVDDLTTFGEKKYMGVCKINNGIARRIDIRCVSKDEYYAALLYFTGSKNFNLFIRKKANSLGYSLNEYGLINKKNKILYPLKSEEELFEILKIPYILPIDRNL